MLFELYISLYSLRRYSKCDGFCKFNREVLILKQALTGTSSAASLLQEQGKYKYCVTTSFVIRNVVDTVPVPTAASAASLATLAALAACVAGKVQNCVVTGTFSKLTWNITSPMQPEWQGLQLMLQMVSNTRRGCQHWHLVASSSAAADSMLVAYSDAADFPAASAVSTASLAASLAAWFADEVWKCVKRELGNCLCHDNSH